MLDPLHGYSVKGTYVYLTTPCVPSERGRFDDVLVKEAPLKVSVFVWRLLCNRIPTKDNLLCRRIIPFDDISCIAGCDSFETVDHLLFHCPHFGVVWHHIFQWLDISFIAPASISDHLHQFCHMAGFPRAIHSFLKVIWMATVWVIWK